MLTSLGISTWVDKPQDELFLRKPQSWQNIPDGIYAVNALGCPVTANAADQSSIAVALISDNQRIWIEKNGELNTSSVKAAYDADMELPLKPTSSFIGVLSIPIFPSLRI